MRPSAFLSFPFADNPEWNKEEVKRYANVLWNNGLNPIVPHLNFCFLNEESDRMEILESCLDLINLTEEFWVCGTNISTGMQYEIDHVLKTKRHLNQLVFYNDIPVLFSKLEAPITAEKHNENIDLD